MARHRKAKGRSAAVGKAAVVMAGSGAVDELVRCAPWVALVCVGILGKWDAAQITAVITCLFPVLLVRSSKTAQV